MVDIDPGAALRAAGSRRATSPTPIGAQNVILPDGHGEDRRAASTRSLLNSSPEVVDEIGDLPIKTVDGTTVYVRDVANVRDGYAPQTNMVHVERQARACSCRSSRTAAPARSTSSRASATMLPGDRWRRCPKELKVTLLFDQSVFVRAAVEGVVKEAVIAAGADRR